LSLPNLVIGLALLILGHTTATHQPLQMINDFLFGMAYGPPVAALIVIVLLLAGCIAESRPYAAILTLGLNVAALALVLIRVGGPSNLDRGFFFLPVLFALIGFGWIAFRGFSPRPLPEA
ncbi:MAG: hypothetical protein M3N12_01585, partial [Verrucomicrobiota bacterium]|nr:hypothetical protein [Verrucomicrobiota bacterium]